MLGPLTAPRQALRAQRQGRVTCRKGSATESWQDFQGRCCCLKHGRAQFEDKRKNFNRKDRC